MAKMRTFIIQNENIFPNTLSLTNAYTNEDLRSFRWRNLILNDYSTIKKTKAFCDFILYLEAYNNQKQSEISNRKSLFISVF